MIQPYFQIAERHVHQDQLLNINGLECIVSKLEPPNGLVTSTTQITFDESFSSPIHQICLIPYLEDVPIEIRLLDTSELIKIILDFYLMPFLNG